MDTLFVSKDDMFTLASFFRPLYGYNFRSSMDQTMSDIARGEPSMSQDLHRNLTIRHDTSVYFMGNLDKDVYVTKQRHHVYKTPRIENRFRSKSTSLDTAEP